MTIARRPDWPARLNLAIRLHMKGEFEWGQYDCGTLFSDAVYAMTDFDPMQPFGRWKSETDVMRTMVTLGVKTLKDYVISVLPEIAPAMARRGDVGYAAEVGTLSCPAIILGTEAVSRDQSGWVSIPTTSLVTAYRVG